MQGIVNALNSIDSALWGVPMIVVLFGTHIFFTFRTGFIQRKIFTGIKLSVTKDSDSEGDVSQFGALSTALAATVGTGNIIGVSTAITLGGPGAVLWMWLTGVLGIATKYAESLISVKYRVKTENGSMLGGAMYALERGLNMKWLGIIFCIFTTVAAFGIGCSTQTNAISSTLKDSFGIPMWASGIIITVFIGVVIIGGVQSITKVCERLVPFMAIFYLMGCLIILIMNVDVLGQAITTIVAAAFSPSAAGGGFIGSTVAVACRYGAARGLFSNEAGMGSAPIVAAAAKTRNPVRQALVSMTGPFWDTVVICLMTGLVIVSSIIKNPAIDTKTSSLLTSAAWHQIPVVGSVIIAIALTTFALSTVLGWSYYGERAAEYLFGRNIIKPYRVLWVIVAFIGTIASLNLVWTIADILNALMVIPNVIAMFLLNGVIVSETKKYINNLDLPSEEKEKVS
ncbi:MAG: alanine:cation symporter family protein [Clostridium sp.]|jgi:AGCS family alanine or glycine:cation symporter|uniref:alanine/glycine:cation symporter family protein n=1 Tax=Clostridium sp. TaxID=1506 RepID=UPI0025C4AE59|nr:alanine/glycine:cation symporter family protein [Clostridium sp.]MCH3965945.1 alanine:cation symporter family protein [Clostridium sp.]MCI1715966.1 alanine:cation symporter family protein [Clostridium sp.]MCI1800362.1 alanine:cation symporter family protein [Clostridium sp.]MCI1814143.1 alanine:cation symporter family protein [Clostridium sp.]MCI1871042.1 alanine:cation symporter family protein [Clostridium sp.]